MRTEISIKHSTYMMTIAEVIEAIEALTVGKVIRLSEGGGKLTFTIEIPEPETQWRYEGAECKMCGGDWSLNDEGYCSRCWIIWNG